MSNGVTRAVGKAIAHPDRVVPALKRKIGTLAYYFGDGSRAADPCRITLFVNNVCNARCTVCDVGQRNRGSAFFQQATQSGDRLFSTDDCRLLMSQVAHIRPQINLHGVEPLLHPSLLDLIATIKRTGCFLSLTTNGTLLPQVASDLIDLRVDSVTVSLDGPERLHDRIRGSAAYRPALEGIQLLKQRRARSARASTRISTSFCISDSNYRSITEYADLMLRQAQVDHITFIHLQYVTESASEAFNRQFSSLGRATPTHLQATDLARIDPEALWDQLQQVRSRYPADRVDYNIDFRRKSKLLSFYRDPCHFFLKKTCKVPWVSSTVLANGDVIINSRCFPYRTGNIHESTFPEIWRGERYKSFRMAVRKAGVFPVCSRCCGTYPRVVH